MRVLELFSGTKSISKALVGNEIISVDILDTHKPSIVSDIMKWDYKIYPSGYFNVIWASPPCTQYSKAKTTGIRNIEEANKIVLRTIEIIEYFNPDVWFIENPQTGLLKDQEFMGFLPYYDVDYCQYGMMYRKRTRIWTNLENLNAKLCPGANKCLAMNGKKHKLSCGNGYTSDTKTSSIYSGCKYSERTVKLNEKYSIPQLLLKDLLHMVLTPPFF
jgi:hypothetical protein